VKKLFAATAILALLAAPALAAEAPKPPLTTGQALNILAGMRAIDTHTIVVKQGADQAIIPNQPWEYGDGKFRLRISRNISALKTLADAHEEARQRIVAEIMQTMPAPAPGKTKEIAPNTPEFEKFSQQYKDLIAAPAQVDLFRIKASELKLDKNEIPAESIALLAPIFDDDVSPKDAPK